MVGSAACQCPRLSWLSRQDDTGVMHGNLTKLRDLVGRRLKPGGFSYDTQ